jgi:tRNA(Ile)-lysidine synthetase-like protein
MAVLDFLLNGRKSITVVHFDHGTEHANEARQFITDYCRLKKIPIVVKEIQRSKSKEESPEEHWRNERYRFFRGISSSIVTGHNLDDAVEWWIMTSLHGQPRLIPYRHGNVIRPFLLAEKSELLEWVERKNIPYVLDPSNKSDKFSRSIVREHIMPHALKVNPGIRKVVKRLLKESTTSF